MDENGEIGGRLAITVFPRYSGELAPPRPFLVPSFDGEVVEILPTQKANRKINFDESTYICEIENRFYYNDFPEDDEEGSYDIEIVDENDDDADFYLEIVDGEVYYVFETEDDISIEDECSYESEEEDSSSEGPIHSVQLPIESMQIPDFDGDASILHMNIDSVSAEIEEETKNQIEDFSSVEECDSEHPEIEAITVSTSDDERSPDETPHLVISDTDSSMVDAKQQALQEEIALIEAQLAEEKQKIAKESDLEQQHHVVEVTEIESPPASPTKATSSMDSPKVTNVFSGDAVTPVSAPKRKIGGEAPESPVRGAQPCTPVKSILRACPESPRKTPKRKNKSKQTDSPKKEKTFSKTYVRAETFDGEHRVYAWAKPDWAENAKLKSTSLGDRLRNGDNLASPITFPNKKPANADLEDEDDEYESVNTDELIRRIKSGSGYLKSQRKLKVTVRGASIRDGGDLVKPVTMATTTKREYAFKKPDWTEKKLNATESGQLVKAGGDMQAPVTMATTQKKYEWQKPVWATQKVLKGDKKLESKEEKKAYTWEKPSWAKEKAAKSNEVLRRTEQGSQARQGDKLEKPITSLPDLSKQRSDEK